MKRFHFDNSYRVFLYISKAPFKFTKLLNPMFEFKKHGWSFYWSYWDIGYVNMNKIKPTESPKS